MLRAIQITRNNFKSLNIIKSTYTNSSNLSTISVKFIPVQILGTPTSKVTIQGTLFASKRFYASKKLKSILC